MENSSRRERTVRIERVRVEIVRTWGAAVLSPYTDSEISWVAWKRGGGLKPPPSKIEGGAPLGGIDRGGLGSRSMPTATSKARLEGENPHALEPKGATPKGLRVAEVWVGRHRPDGGVRGAVDAIGVRCGWSDCRHGSAKRVVEQMLSFAWLGGWRSGTVGALGFTLVLFGDRT